MFGSPSSFNGTEKLYHYETISKNELPSKYTYYANEVSRGSLYTICFIVFWSDSQALALSIQKF